MESKSTSFQSFIAQSLAMNPDLVQYPIPTPPEPRDTNPRTPIYEHEEDEFEYPFSWIATANDHDNALFYDSGWPEVKQMLHQTEEIPLGPFPNNIVRWVWSQAGENDGNPWDALFELEPDENGARFAYYHAWCDYTGFDCQGGQEITLARDVASLVLYAMGNEAYDRYIRTTNPM